MTTGDLLLVQRNPVWSVDVQTDRRGHLTPPRFKVMSSLQLPGTQQQYTDTPHPIELAHAMPIAVDCDPYVSVQIPVTAVHEISPPKRYAGSSSTILAK